MAILTITPLQSVKTVASKPTTTAILVAASNAEATLPKKEDLTRAKLEEETSFRYYAETAAPSEIESAMSLSKKDLAWFGSERFLQEFNDFLARKEAQTYAPLMKEVHKDEQRAHRAQMAIKGSQIVADYLIEEMAAAYYLGGNPRYQWHEVKSLCKGVRSQALREAKKTHGFNAKLFREIAEELLTTSFCKRLLERLNQKPQNQED